MGSVKDLLVTEPAYVDQAGVGSFVFSDRYSVFDWGEMPDHLAGKGRALAVMAAYNFEELERRGFRTHYRGLVADDENDQAATPDAFDVLHFVARKRLAAGRLTAIDATNVQADARKPLVALAREYHAVPVAIVFDLPEHVCHTGDCSARAFATCTCCARPRRSRPRRSSGSRCGSTASTIVVHSTRSATSMDVMTSWWRCSTRSGTCAPARDQRGLGRAMGRQRWAR